MIKYSINGAITNEPRPLNYKMILFITYLENYLFYNVQANSNRMIKINRVFLNRTFYFNLPLPAIVIPVAIPIFLSKYSAIMINDAIYVQPVETPSIIR